MKASSVTSRQKRKILLNAKLVILDSLYKGNGQARLAEEYGVGKSTISNTVLDNQGVCTSRKVMRLAKEEPGKERFYYFVILVSRRIFPSVRKYLCGSSLPQALLLLDNAISHPYIDVLQSSDKNISAMYIYQLTQPS